MSSKKITLDFSGLKCPKPLSDFQKALKTNSDINHFYVICTDSNSVDDFKSFQDFGVIKIINMKEIDSTYHFEIERTYSGEA